MFSASKALMVMAFSLCGSCWADLLPLFIHPLSIAFTQGPELESRLCSGENSLLPFLSCFSSPTAGPLFVPSDPGSSKKGFLDNLTSDPFCAVSGLDPPKRGSPQQTSSFFCAAGPLFVPSAAWILPKGTSSFFCCWAPFCAVSGLDPPKRGSPQPDLRLQPFPAAGPLFVPSAAWILQKGIPRNLTSDFVLFLLLHPFLCSWPGFRLLPEPPFQ